MIFSSSFFVFFFKLLFLLSFIKSEWIFISAYKYKYLSDFSMQISLIFKNVYFFFCFIWFLLFKKKHLWDKSLVHRFALQMMMISFHCFISLMMLITYIFWFLEHFGKSFKQLKREFTYTAILIYKL